MAQEMLSLTSLLSQIRGRYICRKRRHWSGLGRTNGKGRLRARRRANSSEKRLSTFVKASTVLVQPSRQLQSDSRKRDVQVLICRHQKVLQRRQKNRQRATVAKRRAVSVHQQNARE